MIKNINLKWELYYSSCKTNLDKIFTLDHFHIASLPALFDFELYKNKVLGHPYYSTNNWDYQKYEGYHQYYVKKFVSNKKRKMIRFNGIDTIAEIYLNNELIGTTSNCFLKYTFELNNLKKENTLIVHILPSVEEGLKHDFSNIRQAAKYNYEALYVRKPASSFGWDILPRTPLGGIYKTVDLFDEESLIENLFINPINVTKEKAVLAISLSPKENTKFEVIGECDGSHFKTELIDETQIEIINPKLWTIRGFGQQNLYEIKINAYKNDILVESKTIQYGIRKVLLSRTSTVKEDGKFEFIINDEKVFLLGSNWVPVEAIKHVDIKRAKKALKLLLDIGCNAIRIWGGGIYEEDEIYSLCDKLGIFIWQDFMMGCATYPQDDEFAKCLKLEVETKVKDLRNHCSICLWAGDNENDCASTFWAINKKDPNENILTRQVIPNVLNEFDQSRPYLPSSPYIDGYAYAHQNEQLSEDHLWGPRDYFKGEYYKNAYPYFTSETGYHGLNSPKSLHKFMKAPWPIFDNNDQPTREYMCHGVSVKDDLDSPYLYRTRLMADQVKTLFTNEFTTLKDFSLASQISQAEAMKYFIEKMRRDTNRNGGIIWWNILDGWPQVSDAIVDYYFDKKLAYYYIKKSQQPILVFIDESKEKEKIYLSSLDSGSHFISYSITDAFDNTFVLEGKTYFGSKACQLLNEFKNDGKKHFYIIKYCLDGNIKCLNTFYTNIINIDYNQYVKVLKKYNYFK